MVRRGRRSASASPGAERASSVPGRPPYGLRLLPAAGAARQGALRRGLPACPARGLRPPLPSRAGGSATSPVRGALCGEQRRRRRPPPAMGASQSVEIPGGGTEGYHVLRVRAAGRRGGGRAPRRPLGRRRPLGPAASSSAGPRPSGPTASPGRVALPARRGGAWAAAAATGPAGAPWPGLRGGPWQRWDPRRGPRCRLPVPEERGGELPRRSPGAPPAGLGSALPPRPVPCPGPRRQPGRAPSRPRPGWRDPGGPHRAVGLRRLRFGL